MFARMVCRCVGGVSTTALTVSQSIACRFASHEMNEECRESGNAMQREPGNATQGVAQCNAESRAMQRRESGNAARRAIHEQASEQAVQRREARSAARATLTHTHTHAMFQCR